jgi:hypothetical protein
MLQLVDVGPRAVGAYREVVPDGLMDAVDEAAARLRGARVLHAAFRTAMEPDSTLS